MISLVVSGAIFFGTVAFALPFSACQHTVCRLNRVWIDCDISPNKISYPLAPLTALHKLQERLFCALPWLCPRRACWPTQAVKNLTTAKHNLRVKCEAELPSMVTPCPMDMAMREFFFCGQPHTDHFYIKI